MSDQQRSASPSEEDSGFYHKGQTKKKERPKHYRKRQIFKSEKAKKKTHTNKEKEKNSKHELLGQQRAHIIIDKMTKAYENDVERYKKGKVACRKLQYLDDLARELKNIHTCKKFLDMDGLSKFEAWLSKIPTPDGEKQPSLALRKGLFEILADIRVKREQIVPAQELQLTIQANRRSECKDLRDLSEQIISKWNRISSNDDYYNE